MTASRTKSVFVGQYLNSSMNLPIRSTSEAGNEIVRNSPLPFLSFVKLATPRIKRLIFLTRCREGIVVFRQIHDHKIFYEAFIYPASGKLVSPFLGTAGNL